MKNKCQITIADIKLTVMSEYEPDYVERLAKKADEALSPLLASAHYSKVEAALLCLLDAIDNGEKKDADILQLKKTLQSTRLDMEILKIEKEKLSQKPNT